MIVENHYLFAVNYSVVVRCLLVVDCETGVKSVVDEQGVSENGVEKEIVLVIEKIFVLATY